MVNAAKNLNKDHVLGFSPIMDDSGGIAKVLILGSAPSVKSLEHQEYYAHPQNAFWWIMSQIFDFEDTLPYRSRQQCLTRNGIIIWDVLASCKRAGSLDSRIEAATEVANDIPGLLEKHEAIQTILCNGGTAFRLLKKHYAYLFDENYDIIQMPSTSPAYASLSKQKKLEKWLLLNAI